MSSTADHQQSNFNPTWMRAAFNGGAPPVVSRVLGDPSDQGDYQIAPPVFVEHRYGREDLLALVQRDVRPPDGLERCDALFMEQYQPPISIFPLSEVEQKLQANINSSKAMSALSPAERAQVTTMSASAAPSGGGGSIPRPLPGAPPQNTNSGGWTPVKSPWNRSTASSGGPGRGGTAAGTTPTRGGYAWQRGGAQSAGGGGMGGIAPPAAVANEENATPYSGRFAATRVGVSARGGSATASFNSRAQGLYDPRDPKDRPRNRLRSTSDEDGASAPQQPGTGAGSAPPAAAPARGGRFGPGGANGWGAAPRLPSDSLPEWMNTSDDESTGNSRGQSDDRSGGGSFDESGKFRAVTEAGPPVNAWGRQTSQQLAQGDQRSGSEQSKETSGSPPTSVPATSMGGDSTSDASYLNNMNPAAAAHLAYSRMLEATQQHQQAAAAAQAAAVAAAAPKVPPKFFYLDPSSQERGPFEKEQMDAWMKMGYFEAGLKVRRDCDREYTPLGELMKMNGTLTPFDYKQPTVSSGPPPFLSGLMDTRSGLGGLWNGHAPTSGVDLSAFGFAGTGGVPTSSAGFVDPTTNHLMMERRRIEEENRRLLEETMRMKEFAEHMKREKEREEERINQLREREEQLRNYQEEIQRREQQIHETAKQMEARLEMERLQLQEKERKLESEQRAAQETERLAREEEERVKREQEAQEQKVREEEANREKERKQKEEQERRRKQAEEAADAEKRRLEQAASQAAHAIRAKEEAERKKKQQEEETRRRREEQQRKKEEEDLKKLQVTEEWEAARKKERTKVAPWAGATVVVPPQKEDLKKILEEEERLAQLEKQRLEKQRKEEARLNQHQNIASAGMWSNAASRLASSGTSKTSVAGGNPWGSTPTVTSSARVNPMLDGPPLSSTTSSKPTAKKAAPALVMKPTQKKAPAPTFQQWAQARMSDLNSSVESSVLYSFVADLDNPNDVEDYLVGYLGESKLVKEFVRDFLKKRSDMRGGNSNGKKEVIDFMCTKDLSKNSSGNEWTSTGKNKKAKSKGKMVIDGACLGFTPTGDSSRINKGEIETVAMIPGQRR